MIEILIWQTKHITTPQEYSQSSQVNDAFWAVSGWFLAKKAYLAMLGRAKRVFCELWLTFMGMRRYFATIEIRSVSAEEGCM